MFRLIVRTPEEHLNKITEFESLNSSVVTVLNVKRKSFSSTSMINRQACQYGILFLSHPVHNPADSYQMQI